MAPLARTIWFTDTKLPTMWLACTELVVAICLHAYIVYLCIKHQDILQQEMPMYLRWFVILTIAAILSCFLHPGRKGTYFFSQQMFVSFTMFTEAISLLPQIYHMHMSQGLEGLNSKYLFALALSRFSRIYFWYTMSGKHISTFWYLISADALYTLVVIGNAVMFRNTAKTVTMQDGILGATTRRLSRDD